MHDEDRTPWEQLQFDYWSRVDGEEEVLDSDDAYPETAGQQDGFWYYPADTED